MFDSVRVRVVSGEERVMAERAKASAAASVQSVAYFLKTGHEGRRTFTLPDFLVSVLLALARLHDLRRNTSL